MSGMTTIDGVGTGRKLAAHEARVPLWCGQQPLGDGGSYTVFGTCGNGLDARPSAKDAGDPRGAVHVGRYASAIVVGAGISGASAALTLRRQGIDVTLYDA